ncbi:MAG: tRNA (adenosine(37)-N6)-threonylcarbamoyltransferase complex dimerization subunit type 1 TsaB [Dehalococcoidales bacterium]
MAIDTSTDIAGLALLRDDRIVAELNWLCGRSHSTQLLPSLNRLLEQAGLSLEEAECVIVARGPGSYNGLRVGISTAKALAYSLGIPVIGISTLEGEAYQHAGTGLPVCPLFNAGREEIATATFQQEGGQWRQLLEERLTTLDALCSEVTEKTLFCGEFVPVIADRLKKQLKEKAVIPSQAGLLRRAGFLAELGLKRFRAGDSDDPATLQPHYFRGPSITKPKTAKK